MNRSPTAGPDLTSPASGHQRRADRFDDPRDPPSFTNFRSIRPRPSGRARHLWYACCVDGAGRAVRAAQSGSADCPMHKATILATIVPRIGSTTTWEAVRWTVDGSGGLTPVRHPAPRDRQRLPAQTVCSHPRSRPDHGVADRARPAPSSGSYFGDKLKATPGALIIDVLLGPPTLARSITGAVMM
jgi:hypothetical protein